MKKNLIAILLVMILSTQSWALLYEVQIPTKEELKKMKKEELIEKYIDALIERKASETFYSKAGFAPKEYQAFKDLLLLIVRLREEMVARDMDAPPIAEWLK